MIGSNNTKKFIVQSQPQRLKSQLIVELFCLILTVSRSIFLYTTWFYEEPVTFYNLRNAVIQSSWLSWLVVYHPREKTKTIKNEEKGLHKRTNRRAGLIALSEMKGKWLCCYWDPDSTIVNMNWHKLALSKNRKIPWFDPVHLGWTVNWHFR